MLGIESCLFRNSVVVLVYWNSVLEEEKLIRKLNTFVGVAGREQSGEPGRRAGLLLLGLGVPPAAALRRPAAGDAQRHRRVHPAHRVLSPPGQR